MGSPFKLAWRVLTSFVSRLHAAVTGIHANWWALIAIVVTLAIAAITLDLQSGSTTASPPPPPGADRPLKSPPEEEDPSLPGPDPDLLENRIVGSGEARAGSCERLYADEKESQFEDLIEAEVAKCVPIATNAMKLYFSCTSHGANSSIVLKYQVSDAVERHVVRMSAAYSGPKEVDLSQVKLTTLNRGLEDACHQRGRSIR